MEILNTTYHHLEFWLLIIFVGIFTLLFITLMCLGWFVTISGKEFTSENIVPSLVYTAISMIGIACLVIQIIDGVRVSYEIKVDDWNEVYEQGYKVTKQKGDIVTVELVE